MASPPTAAFPLADLYLSHPHILTSILYACSPTTFDALRYTCKAIYSMSLDPALLQHHLTTIVDRQREVLATHPYDLWNKPAPTIDSKYDTIHKASSNLWRLRGLLLQELLRMKSSWRIGESRKTVLTLDNYDDESDHDFVSDEDDLRFNGTVHVAIGPVRGDTLAISWSDKRRTRLHTYRFSTARSHGVRPIAGPEHLDISHSFDDKGNYLHSTFTTNGTGRYSHVLLFNDREPPNPLSISISEGQFKRHPALIGEEHRSYYTWHGYRGFMPDKKEVTTTLLRVKFHGRYANEPAFADTSGDVDLAYELQWIEKRKWRVPALNLRDSPNTVLPDHGEEPMHFTLQKDGRCLGTGYAIGMDDQPVTGDGKKKRVWKITEPRRLDQDVSRMGVWRDMRVVFSQDKATLKVKGVVARNLVFRPPTQRFLLTKPSSATKPEDWIRVVISLVLPPTTHGEKRGKLTLATPAPAAYFRKLGLRDPEIPWRDPGMLNYEWEPQITSQAMRSEVAARAAMVVAGRSTDGQPSGPQPMYIRTGCMLHEDMVDAEVLLRVVGYTDDSAVWVWEVTERDVLDCGEQAGTAASANVSPVGRIEVAGRKLGYVEGVRGMATTGDRLVERVILFTWGKEGRVHRGGKMADDGQGIDAGIAELRREDLVRRIEQAREKKEIYRERPDDAEGSSLLEEEVEVVETEEEKDEGSDEKNRWRIVTYSFGDQPGTNGGFTMNSSGALEEQW
ncbi:hypothetical protein TWF696_007900 [Orbilia brochopaga]|uniref:F-box domain-containing protein n=1 Tax=Orbilia brochopaga TaxID=3140254 RepID=A0AAV9ULI1_9PEZI